MSTKPRISKGTRDFLPADVQKREYVWDIRWFRKPGYQPIETQL